MKLLAKPRFLVALLIAQAGFWIGCESSETKKLNSLKVSLVASQEPASPKTIAEAKEKIAETKDVVIRGVIKARNLDPFEKNKSIFIVTDIIEDEHGGDPNHNADDCPFCKHRAENAAMAQVRLVDEQGNPHPYSAAELLNAKEGDVVVVTGSATFDEAVDLFSITAKQVYVAKK